MNGNSTSSSVSLRLATVRQPSGLPDTPRLGQTRGWLGQSQAGGLRYYLTSHNVCNFTDATVLILMAMLYD
jgi:hypothetical protein